jgi:CDP-glucose 4,6-dehydratase
MTDLFWQDRRVFVTGCTGLVGSWLSAELVTRGADVVGLVRDRVGRSLLWRNGAAPRMTLVDGDISDYALIERVLAEYEIDTIFHLAAQTIVGIANRSPLSTFETNIKGTWVLLEAARRTPHVSRIVVASSDKAYGDQEKMPYTEDAPLQGRHPYDVSKSAADLICLAYGNTYRLPVIVTRCANLYGGGDLNWNRIVPGTIRSLLRGERPIIRSDGTLLRDYMYVQDAVEAYLLTARRADDPDLHGSAFNFGLNTPVSVRQIVDTLIALSPTPQVQPQVLNEANHEIRVQYLDATRARERLAWEPRYPLQDGLRRTLAWYTDYLMSDRQE